VSSSKVLRTKSAPRDSYHHGDLEAALLEAAINLVRANGPDHLSLRAVAEQVGVSPSAVYHYFPDKDSLISEVGDRLFVNMAQMQREALGQIPGSSARAAKLRYRELGRTYFRWANAEPNLFRLMFGGFCKIEKSGAHEGEEAFIMLSKCLDDLLATGVITPQMRRYGELISWSAVQGASTLIIEGIIPEAAFEELLDGLEIAMRAGAK
jgi:AcrR family transcriptional regulator